MKSDKTKLHLGCGLTTPASWLNVDGSLNAKLARRPLLRKFLGSLGILSRHQTDVPWATNVFIHDVRKPLPWTEGTFTAVYASHLLEHMYVADANRLLRECFRVLKPGGAIRIVVPDLWDIIDAYQQRRVTTWALPQGFHSTRGDELVGRLLMREMDPPRGGWFLRAYRAVNDFHSHKWMYDEESLHQRFKEAGFTEISRRGCFESRIEGVREVENPDRVNVDGGLCMEAVKP
ncbi:MAG: class I SAM-dependent methyltransferase [Phycisphaerales bacterium]